MYGSLSLQKLNPPFLLNPATWIYIATFFAPLGEITKYFGIEFSFVKIVTAVAIFLTIADRAVRKEPFARTPIDFFLLLFVLSFIPSLTRTSDFHYLLIVVLTIAGYFVLNILIVNYITEKKILSGIISMLLFSTFIISVLGIAQLITGKTFLNVFGIEDLHSLGDTQLLLGTEKNPNAFASHFIVVIPLAFSLFLCSKRNSSKAIYCICILFYSILLFLTASRGAIIGAMASVIIITVFYAAKKNYRILNSFLSITFIVAVALIFFWQIFPDYTIESIFGEESNIAIYAKNASTRERVLLMKANFRTFVENPVVGAGFDNSIFDTVRYGCRNPGPPHSIILGIGCELGLLGLIPFLLIMYIYSRTLLKAIKSVNDPQLFGLLTGLFGSFAAQQIFGLTHMNYISISLWLVTGLSFAGVEIMRKDQYKEKKL